MSPWPAESLHVDLRPEAVTLARVRGRFGFAAQQPRVCAPVAASAAGEPAWRPAVAALQGALETVKRARVTVVLSSRFVRHAVVPAGDADGDEARALAHHAFERIYGDATVGWTLRVDMGNADAPRVASAVDTALLAALRDACEAAHVRLDSIQPALMAVHNAHLRQFARRHAWLALVEPGSLVLALLRRGRWLRLRSLRVGPAWRVELARILEREAFLVEPDAVASDVLLWTAGVGDAALPENDRWRFHLLAADAAAVAPPEANLAEA